MGRPSVKNKSFWKTQLAQYDPANYNTEMEYHQVFAEKFSKSWDKLRPSIKKFISGYYASHKQGMDTDKKVAFYRLHPDVFPAMEAAPAKGDNINSSAIQAAIEDVRIARGQKPDSTGAARTWGGVDVNAPEDHSFVNSRKQDLLLSLSTEDDAKNPSDDPKEKAESEESAYELNDQKNTSLKPEAPHQDPATVSVGDRERLAVKDFGTKFKAAEKQYKQAKESYVASQLAAEHARWKELDKTKNTADFATWKKTKEGEDAKKEAQDVFEQSNPKPSQEELAQQERAKFGVGPGADNAPRIQRQTDTEAVRGQGQGDASAQAAWQAFGDAILDTETVDRATPSLRPQYGMEGASAVVPSSAKQLASDLGFDMFSWVRKGFGNGADNKLFLQQEARDKFIRYAGDMYGPGPHIGPVAGIKPMPMAWSSVKPKGFIDKTRNDFNKHSKLAVHVYDEHAGQNGTALALPDDRGSYHLFSSKELPRKRSTPLEPIYNNYSVFRPVRDAVGSQRPAKLARLAHDPIRDPFNINTDTQSGIPHLPYSLAVQEILR